MLGSHTQRASDYMDDLAAAEAADIWADLGELNETSTAAQWKAKMERIAREYLLTSRFALMRILHNRAQKEKSEYQFPFGEISAEHAANMPPEEHTRYMAWLLEIAGPSPEEDPDLHERILSRAWHDEDSANALIAFGLKDMRKADPRKYQKHVLRLEKENKKRFGTRLTREEALQLGHILRFTRMEMEWFLLRVFDVEDGLRMNRASDLIEAFCFETGATCDRTARLKEEYARRSAGIEKRDDAARNDNWTRQTAGALLERIKSWEQYPETLDEKFLTWLEQHASGLDIPSRTARRVYRNLAAYTYCAGIPDEAELLDELLDLCDMDDESDEVLRCLYCDGELSRERCDQVAEYLYQENKMASGPEMKDSTQLWSVITARKDKKLSSSYGAVNSSRTRIQSLLMGTEEVEKGDLLYLLWFAFNIVWTDSEESGYNVICDRIYDLKEAAAAFLEKALLPTFYLPHLMEQSMLLSIIYAGKTGEDPSAVYGDVLQALKESRVREGGSQKHSLQEKIDIVNQYRDGMTLKACAVLNGISEKTLSQWQQDLVKKGVALNPPKQKTK